MKFFHVLFIMAVMVVGVLNGVGAFISKDQGRTTNLKLSKHNTFAILHHDADSANSDISSNEDEEKIFGYLKPYAIKLHMKNVLINMDQNKNGFIEQNELKDRLLKVYKKQLTQDADIEFKKNDVNNDGYITWQEYVDAPDTIADYDDIVSDEAKLYLASDIDYDGLLSKKEFRCFYMPEDCSHTNSVLNSNSMNSGKDGRIIYEKFPKEDIKCLLNGDHDFNLNGVPDKDELYNWTFPDIETIAKKETRKLIVSSDINSDGKLSFDEVLDDYTTFITPDSEAYYIFVDELFE